MIQPIASYRRVFRGNNRLCERGYVDSGITLPRDEELFVTSVLGKLGEKRFESLEIVLGRVVVIVQGLPIIVDLHVRHRATSDSTGGAREREMGNKTGKMNIVMMKRREL